MTRTLQAFQSSQAIHFQPSKTAFENTKILNGDLFIPHKFTQNK